MKILTILFASFIFCSSCKVDNSLKTYGNAYINGNWYDGNRFVSRTFYEINGYLSNEKPDSLINTIDLRKGFVIPPFGSAHNHNLDRKWQLDFLPNAYLNEGTFYYQNLTSSARQSNEVRPFFATDSTLDVSYAMQGFTSTLGHPFLAFEPASMGFGYNWEVWQKHMDSIMASRIEEDNSYIFIDSVPQIENKMKAFLQAKPDVAKVYILDIENYQTNSKTGIAGLHGLSKDVAKTLVRRLHEEDLMVYAHIETAADFAFASEIGVDCAAHMPGYNYDGLEENKERYYVHDSIIEKVVAGNMAVIPTVAIGLDRTTTKDKVAKAEFVRDFLKRFSAAGGTVAVGSDRFNETLSFELGPLIDLNAFTNKELLKILCYNTPRLIFPHREIGLLKEGYEASFLLLKENPLNRIESIRDIQLKVKQGIVLETKS